MDIGTFEVKYGIGIHDAVRIYNESCAKSASRHGLLRTILFASPEIEFWELVRDVIMVCGKEGLKLNVPLPMDSLPSGLHYKPAQNLSLPLGKIQSMRGLVLDEDLTDGSRKAACGVLISNGKAVATNMMAMVVAKYREKGLAKFEGQIISPVSGRKITAPVSKFPDYHKAIRKATNISENYLTGFLLSHFRGILISLGNISEIPALVRINVGGQRFVLMVEDLVACIRALEAFGASKIAFCPLIDRLVLMANNLDFAVLMDIKRATADRVIKLDFDIQCRPISLHGEKVPDKKPVPAASPRVKSCNGFLIFKSWNIANWNFFELKIDGIEVGIKKIGAASFCGFYVDSNAGVGYFTIQMDEATQSAVIVDLSIEAGSSLAVVVEANKRLVQRKREGTARKCIAWMHQNARIEKMLEAQVNLG